MRWKPKSKLPINPKPGECHLFILNSQILPKFLDCGCVVWRRPHIETHTYGALLLAQVGFRSIHQWRSKTNCYKCIEAMMVEAGDGPSSMAEFIKDERERGVHIHD